MDGKTLFDLHRDIRFTKVHEGPERDFFTYSNLRDYFDRMGGIQPITVQDDNSIDCVSHYWTGSVEVLFELIMDTDFDAKLFLGIRGRDNSEVKKLENRIVEDSNYYGGRDLN